ncbi:hypothetical protein BHM03_00041965 [Ensete ventricosum]|uniref:Uncharacterized protein n=1 Tax=Ensete ventricosum TaxID=4639 RepID=A0A445MKE4_ENSVE|nr:hypothetical protein BHM03_00041965 [Ensete ventricosum]
MTVPEMPKRAKQYVIAETLVAEKCEDQKRPRAEPSRGPPSRLSRRRVERAEQAILEKGLLKAPSLMRTRSKERDRGRYCRLPWELSALPKCLQSRPFSSEFSASPKGFQSRRAFSLVLELSVLISSQ